MTNDVSGVGPSALSKIADVGANRKVTSDEGAQKGSQKELAARPDTVEVTAQARLLERVEASLAGTPDVDSKRVDALQNAISQGSYQIDDQAIADRLLRIEKELG